MSAGGETRVEWFDGALTAQGELVVNPDGSLTVTGQGDYWGELGSVGVNDALVLARAILRAARPTLRLVEAVELRDVVETLESWLEPEDTDE